jgi:hypothetical protein
MKLLLLENESSVDGLETLSGYSPGTDKIICFNYLVAERLKKLAGLHSFIFCEDLLDAEGYRGLHDATDQIALGWFRRDGEDFSLYDGISYGDLVKAMFSHSFLLSVLVKYGELIRRAVLLSPNATDIWHDFSGNGISSACWGDEDGRYFNKARLVHVVAGQLNKPTRFIEPPRPLQSACVNYRTVEPKQGMRFRIAGLAECVLNAWSRLWNTLWGREQRVFIYPYINLFSLRRYLNHRIILPRITNRWVSSTLLRGVGFLDFSSLPHRFCDSEIQFLRSLELRLSSPPRPTVDQDLFVFHGIDYREVYQPVIRFLVLEKIPGLVRWAAQVRKGLREQNIGCMVLWNNLDVESKTTMAVCKATGVATVFSDHGLMGHRHAQKALDRPVPDVLIVPGTFDPYEQGIRPISLGNPALDPYPKEARKHVTRIRRVLLLSFEDNFYARLDRFAWQEKYYEELLPIIPALCACGIEVIYKPHPSESPAYHDYIFRFFGVNPDLVKNVQMARFTSVIPEVDLMICSVSSCFFEAQAAGVPTVFLEPTFNPDALCPPMNGLPGRDVLRVSTGAELLELISRNHDDASELNQFLDNFLDHVAPESMGDLDGQAGARLMHYVLEHF